MKKKYLKNKYQIVCFLLSTLILVFVSIIALAIGSISAAIFTIGITIGVIFLTTLLGFYFIFQFVYFDNDGIHITLINKEINFISWDQIKEVNESNIYRGPIYQLVLKNGRVLNLDRRKKIKQEIFKYYKKN